MKNVCVMLVCVSVYFSNVDPITLKLEYQLMKFLSKRLFLICLQVEYQLFVPYEVQRPIFKPLSNITVTV